MLGVCGALEDLGRHENRLKSRSKLHIPFKDRVYREGRIVVFVLIEIDRTVDVAGSTLALPSAAGRETFLLGRHGGKEGSKAQFGLMTC